MSKKWLAGLGVAVCLFSLAPFSVAQAAGPGSGDGYWQSGPAMPQGNQQGERRVQANPGMSRPGMPNPNPYMGRPGAPNGGPGRHQVSPRRMMMLLHHVGMMGFVFGALAGMGGTLLCLHWKKKHHRSAAE